MSRGRAGSRKSGSEGQSLVTILFALGVIGWGFFAIDRLTEDGHPQKKSRIKGHVAGQSHTWKKDVRDWLNDKLGNKPGKEQPNSHASVHRNLPQADASDIPVLPEPEGLERETLTRSVPEEESSTESEVGGPTRTRTFLLYRLNRSGMPELSRVKRSLKGDNASLNGLLEAVIKGPRKAEADKYYIDSFVRKPRVRSVKIADGCAIVDFDQTFGAGVSYQTLRYQVTQIYQNLRLWQGVSCLEIKINGRHNPHLGTDGIYFPRRINGEWLRKNA